MPKILRILFLVLIMATLTGCSLSASEQTVQSMPERPDAPLYADASTSAAPTAALTASPTPTAVPLPTPTPTPSVKEITVSFTGDCTLTEDTGTESASYSFSSVMGTDYAYPFRNAVATLSRDDLTLINFEGVFTDSTAAADKEFTFKSPFEYVNILKLGSVEAVNLANNHTYDFGAEGLQDTKDTLDAAGILWSNDTNYAVYEVNGVKIGMAGFLYPSESDLSPIYTAIDSLRSQGCEIVIISVHAGIERMYTPESAQVDIAHAILDYGADIYVGHHPHRLQPVELYNGKYILYSLSNFSFGGQPGLSDPDTAIVQCTFSVSAETDKVVGYKLHVIPYSMTTTYPGNDYCPIAYEKGSEGYQRVMDKMSWSDEMEQ